MSFHVHLNHFFDREPFFCIVNHFLVMNSRLSSGFENVRIVLERLWQGFDQGFDRIWTSYGR